MTPEQRKQLVACVCTIENTKSDMLDMCSSAQARSNARNENYKAWDEFFEVLDAIESRSTVYDEFYTDVSCLFAEGVEFMTTEELYNAFKV